MASTREMRPNELLPLGEVPVVSISEFRGAVLMGVAAGARLAALFGRPYAHDTVQCVAVLADGLTGNMSVSSTLIDDTYRALTPECPQAHWFEREIAEQWGIQPKGHPWLKPLRFHRSYRPGRDVCVALDDETLVPGVTNFFQVQGGEVHEVAVGPVHAGIIEPGHFRFQCHGEQVLHLEISLGYQHRGVERALIGGPGKRTIHQMETLAGDTSVGHATTYCQVLETFAKCQVPARAQALRGIALELERLANHTGDLGALAGDVGYLPTASYCGRIRGDFLNMTALICGNRFGRNLIRPGGVGFDLDSARVDQLLHRLESAFNDVTEAVQLLWNSSSVQARFAETGVISRVTCEELGLVGPPARACGVERDVRHEFPAGIFQFAHIPVATWHSGDVFARAYVRWLEIQRSIAFVGEQLSMLPGGTIQSVPGELLPDHLVVSCVEGWRGEIFHVAGTDSEGRFAFYKVIDPSFHNWLGLAMALRNQQISDFPLCNKSFNLSYCGHDL